MVIICIFFDNVHRVYAHIPYLASDKHDSPESALEIDDITISKVIYQNITNNSPESWIKFHGIKEETLHIQIGLPKINRLHNYRPAIALLKYNDVYLYGNIESIPKTEVLKYQTTDIKNPQISHEPFTNTTSWILFEENITLPETGNYFLTSFSEISGSGKLWIAIGEEESLGISDLGKLSTSVSEIRTFHEIGPLGKFLPYTNIIYIIFILILAFMIITLILLDIRVLKWIKRLNIE